MRLKPTLAFTGLAVALAGVTAVYAADRPQVHVLLVQLPGGGTEQIRYTGNVAPHVLIGDTAAPMAASSFLDTAFGPDSPFAQLDRISAEMDARMAGMMHQAAAMQAMTPAQMQEATLHGAPAGSHFTMISTSSVGGCTQSVRSVSLGDGKAPQVTRTSAGACDTAAARASRPTLTALPAAPQPPAAPIPVAAPARPAAPDRDSI